MTKIKIKRDSKDGTFTGTEGDKILYFWTKGMVLESDIPDLAGATIEFGGKVAHREGEELELDIERNGNGKFREIVEA